MAFVKGPKEVADDAEMGVAPREDVIEIQSWPGAENFLAIPGPWKKTQIPRKVTQLCLKTAGSPLGPQAAPNRSLQEHATALLFSYPFPFCSRWYNPARKRYSPQFSRAVVQATRQLYSSCIWHPNEIATTLTVSYRKRSRITSYLIVAMPFANFLARQVHGISGPVIYQLVQVICESPLPAWGKSSRLRLGCLAVHRSPDCVSAAGPYKYKKWESKLRLKIIFL